MSKGAALVNALMENSKRVQSYEFGSAAAGADAKPTRKLAGSKMIKKVKAPGDARVHYTFAL